MKRIPSAGWKSRLRRTSIVFALLTTVVTATSTPEARASDLNTTLTCRYDVNAIPPTTNRWEVEGSNVKMQLGVTGDFGGIATELNFINKDGNQDPVNVLEARSAAGSAWQTSYWAQVPHNNNLIVFNQAAGNVGGWQWGYQNTFPGTQGASWNPVVSDHYHLFDDPVQGGGFSNPEHQAGPCPENDEGQSYVFEDGNPHYWLTTVPTTSGTGVAILNNYRLRSRMDQYWKTWALEQGMYLNSLIAGYGDLRMYLHGGSGTDAWQEGPIRIYRSFSISPEHAVPARELACDAFSCRYVIRGDVDFRYALFVWNIRGQDFGMAIANPGNLHVYGCAGTSGQDCQTSIQLHDWLEFESNYQIGAGQVRDFLVDYRFGTLDQLRAMGYPDLT